MLTTKKSGARSGKFFLTVALVAALAGCMPAGPRSLLEGERLIGEGQFEPAVEQLKTATELLPQNAQAWNHLGLAYHGAGQVTNAAQAYQRALVLDKNLASPSYNLGCLLLEQGNAAAALDHLKRFTMLQSTSLEGWLKLASAQLRVRDADGAERSYAQALKISPKSVEALNGVGIAELQKRRLRDAVQYFNAALAIQPQYRPALFNVAVVSQQYLNNRTNALQKYREYLHQKPQPANWAAVEQMMRQLEAELNQPPKPVVTNQLAQAAGATNLVATRTNAPANLKPVTATSAATNKVIASALSVTPQISNRVVAPTVPLSAKTNLATNAVARLEAPTNVAAVEPPRLPPAQIVPLAEEPAFKPARDEKPIATPEPTVSIPPPTSSTASPADSQLLPPIESSSRKQKPGFFSRANPVNWFRSNKAKEVSSATDKTPAAATAEPVVSSRSARPPVTPPTRERPSFPRYAYKSPAKPAPGNRDEAEIFFGRGVVEQQQRRLESAIEAYRLATRADPAFFEAYHNLGLAAFEAGDLPASLLAHEMALAINPTHASARCNFALALQKANYAPDAVAELEKVLASAPDDVRAQLALANLYAQQLEEPARARPHYLKVLELEPKHPQAAVIRSWLSSNL
ncbi:MAG: tetratricopeptide repeat protein [Verrucomicrobia bacterium]|nr:tetratricopeptide repeat protein [Verrucomicrobiota bacterium]